MASRKPVGGGKVARRLVVTPHHSDPYEVTVGWGLRLDCSRLLPDGSGRVAVISDSRVSDLYAREVVEGLRSGGRRASLVSFPEGEAHKTRETKRSIEDTMLAMGIHRDGAVVALGGGVTTDLAGFVAATFMRGIPYVNLPTTLLAMVDATVGGKTGVNTGTGKNLIGVFHQPKGVLVDLQTLETLPRRGFVHGLAEMVKHAVIGDEGYLRFLQEHASNLVQSDRDECVDAVARSIAIKAGVVGQDVEEKGLRQVLNFGHTVGHALERLKDYGLSHGEAVSVGMSVEAEIAVRMGILEADSRRGIISAMERLDLPHKLPQVDVDRLIELMHIDKKATTDELRMALPCRIGQMAMQKGSWGIPVSQQTVIEAVRALEEA